MSCEFANMDRILDSGKEPFAEDGVGDSKGSRPLDVTRGGRVMGRGVTAGVVLASCPSNCDSSSRSIFCLFALVSALPGCSSPFIGSVTRYGSSVTPVSIESAGADVLKVPNLLPSHRSMASRDAFVEIRDAVAASRDRRADS